MPPPLQTPPAPATRHPPSRWAARTALVLLLVSLGVLVFLYAASVPELFTAPAPFSFDPLGLGRWVEFTLAALATAHGVLLVCAARAARGLGVPPLPCVAAALVLALLSSFGLFAFGFAPGGNEMAVIAAAFAANVVAAPLMLLALAEARRPPVPLAPEDVALKVTSRMGTLVDVPRARRSDWHVRMEVAGEVASLDLYGHYLRVQRDGLPLPYRAQDWLCRTYVKFGEAIQEREPIEIEIRRARP